MIFVWFHEVKQKKSACRNREQVSDKHRERNSGKSCLLQLYHDESSAADAFLRAEETLDLYAVSVVLVFDFCGFCFAFLLWPTKFRA